MCMRGQPRHTAVCGGGGGGGCVMGIVGSRKIER